MNVLGLHGYSHDAGAALVCDGELYAVALERISRKKYDGSFPEESILYVMEQAGIKSLKKINLAVCDALGMRFGRMRRRLEQMGFTGKIIPLSHHDAHAASAYFAGPFGEAAVLVVDACGSFSREIPGPLPVYAPHRFSRELQSTYVGRGRELEPVSKTYSAPGWSVGPGTMYGFGAMMAGFSDLEGGKLMALAALGARDDVFPDSRFVDFEGTCLAQGDPERDPLTRENLSYYSRLFFRGLAPREPDAPLRRVHCELARAVQRQTSAAAVAMAQFLHRATGCENLCIAGGFGLNCLTNNAYAQQTPFKNIFIQPAATDTGIPLGAALYGYHITAGRPFFPRRFSPYLGKAYATGEILQALRQYPHLKHSRPRRFEKLVAELLAGGKICGWFQGRSEYGPRALGNRSILADPRDPDTPQRLNTRIKFRESFRPYAPAILEDQAAKYFHIHGDSPFMLNFAPARRAAQKAMPAVLHVDGTARLQTVNRENCGPLCRLLEAFHDLTGVPALLNTSFNRRGEPIVETPADALACFVNTDLDFLVLEDHIVFKER